jgi:hypothetical protein
MKKEYVKPETLLEMVITESMLAVSKEGMGTDETPGGDDAFNTPLRRGKWGSLWD